MQQRKREYSYIPSTILPWSLTNKNEGEGEFRLVGSSSTKVLLAKQCRVC